MNPKRLWAVSEDGQVRELGEGRPGQGRSSTWRLPPEWGDSFVMRSDTRPEPGRFQRTDGQPWPESYAPQRGRTEPGSMPWDKRGPEPDRMTTRETTRGTSRPSRFPGGQTTLLATAEPESLADAQRPFPAPRPRTPRQDAGTMPGNPPDNRQPQYRDTGKAAARLGGPDDGKITLLDDELTPIREKQAQPKTGAQDTRPPAKQMEQAPITRPSQQENKKEPTLDPASGSAPAAPGQDKDAKASMQAPKDMRLDEDGIKFIKEREEFKAKPYEDSAHHCTIGYGHLLHNGECTQTDYDRYPDGITEEEASAMMNGKVKESEEAVHKYIQAPLTQHQFNALVSYTYNEGPDNLRISTFRKRLNAGDYDAIPDELRRWNKITVDGRKVPCKGLTNRRELEIQLFNKLR